MEHGRLRFLIQKMSGVKIESVQLTTRGEIGVND